MEIDKLPYELTEGVTATQDGLATGDTLPRPILTVRVVAILCKGGARRCVQSAIA